MFLKCSPRKKDGQEHRSWSVVASRRVGRGVVQRHVLYLGEINDSQRAAWQKAVAVFNDSADRHQLLETEAFKMTVRKMNVSLPTAAAR